MNISLLLSDIFYLNEELHPDLRTEIEPVVDAYMREVLDERSYALFAHVYADGVNDVGTAVAIALNMTVSETEQRYQAGVCDLRFNVSTNARLSDFVVEWCPEFTAAHLLIIRREYENMRRMLKERLGDGAVESQDGLGTTLLRSTVVGKLRGYGITRRSQLRCLRLDELVEIFGFNPEAADRIVRAAQRK